MIELHGERVVLRGFRDDELEALHEERLRSAATVGTQDLELLRARVARSGAWHDGLLHLAVESAGTLAGSLDVRSGRGVLPPGVCELGIELWEGRRGDGLGTDALATLTSWLHAEGFARVQAGTDLGNAAMRRVFEKLGYDLEGTMRAFMPEPGGRHDYALYAHVAG